MTNLADIARQNRKIALSVLAARKAGDTLNPVARMPRLSRPAPTLPFFSSVRAQRTTYSLAA